MIKNYSRKEVLFLQLSLAARSNALQQMAELNQQDTLYDISNAEDFAGMIVDGYNPDRDFMFIQYEGNSDEKVVVYLKDFS